MQFQQKITPFLSFQSQAEEAAEFYVSVLPDSRILKKLPHPDTGQMLTVEFELAGMTFVALNTGAEWEFTNAVSLAVACETQEEIDTLWEQLSADGGEKIQCGWLKDKFGVPWQIVPRALGGWLGGPDAKKTQRVLHAVWGMTKLEIAALESAYAADP